MPQIFASGLISLDLFKGKSAQSSDTFSRFLEFGFRENNVGFQKPIVNTATNKLNKTTNISINDFKDEVFFGRLILKVENEIEEKKILEIDARSSDCIALAVKFDAPVYVAKKVLEKTDDVSEVFHRVESGDLAQKDEQDDNLIV